MVVRIYVERSHRASQVFHPDGRVEESVTERRGACIDVHDPADGVTHRFADGDVLLRDPPIPLAKAVAEEGRRVQSLPLVTLPVDSAAALGTLARASRATLTWGMVHQHIAVGDDVAVTYDERRLSTVEVRLFDGGTQSVRWAPHDPSTGPVGTALTRAREIVALPMRELPSKPVDVVLPPGQAGAFFHELVGHPMEGDVVASGTSYLGRRMGQRVAPEWFTVRDGADLADHGYRAGLDDEGTPSGTLTAIRAGVVADPLTDLASARQLGAVPAGHGRRLDYRHLAIPRMTHTCATTAVEGQLPAEPYLEVSGLQLVMLSVATGDFVFRVRSGRLRDDGRAARLPPLLLSGNGIRVLAELCPGSVRVGESCRATGGCGKLGQFPLLVSFANAGFVLPARSVRVEADDD